MQENQTEMKGKAEPGKKDQKKIIVIVIAILVALLAVLLIMKPWGGGQNTQQGMVWDTSLDVSNFDTSKVTTMSYMFSENSNLTTIYAGNNWDTSNVTISTSMFYKCSKLVGAIAYNSSKTDATYANWTTGYLTHKTTSQSIKLDVSSDGSVNGYTENAA